MSSQASLVGAVKISMGKKKESEESDDENNNNKSEALLTDAQLAIIIINAYNSNM